MITRIKTLIKENRLEFIRFAKFFIVGLLGTVVDFGLFNLFYNILGLPQALSNAMSFTAALLHNYAWNLFWIYPETRGQGMGRKFLIFLAVSSVGLLLNTGILLATDNWVLGEKGLLAGLVAPVAAFINIPHSAFSSNIAKAFATGIVLFWNFAANRLWTFKDAKPAKEETKE